MQALRPVTVDLATGAVTLGSTRVTLQREGEHYVAANGFRGRALTFEERSQVVAGALMEREPNRALLTKLRNLANLPAEALEKLSDALMLALAGGGEKGLDFAACARVASRNGNLDWEAVQQAPAVLVDQLASREASSQHDGWMRFEFRKASPDTLSLEDCCSLMLEQLLERGMPKGPEREELATEPRIWQSTAKICASLNDGEDDGLKPPTDEISTEAASGWPRDAQPVRARAILSRAQAGSDTPPRPADILRENHRWPEGQRRQTPQQSLPKAGSPLTGASVDNGGRTSTGPHLFGLLEKSDERSNPLYPTLRETPADPEKRHEERHLAPAQPKSSTANENRIQPAEEAAARPSLAIRRLREPGRLTEVLANPASAHHEFPPAPAGAVAPALPDIPVPDLRASAISRQRDWLYEIATALEDECELRGLDA
jgi:hypothetical protein